MDNYYEHTEQDISPNTEIHHEMSNENSMQIIASRLEDIRFQKRKLLIRQRREQFLHFGEDRGGAFLARVFYSCILHFLVLSFSGLCGLFFGFFVSLLLCGDELHIR